jgi:hypothetical protein
MLISRDQVHNPRMRAVASVLAVALAAVCIHAQQTVNPPAKPTPPRIAKQLFLMTDSVVTDQWTHTLKLVNAPQNLSLVTPGECIRTGIFATGDNRDAYIAKTRLSFEVKFAGNSQAYAAAPLTAIKQIKPQGGDFVTAALGAAGIKNPLPTFATMGASAEKWCVPADAQDGTVTVQAEAESPDGRQRLTAAKLQVESFATGSKRAFNGDKEFSEFSMEYYRQPEATRLIPVLEYVATDKNINSNPATAEILVAFLGAALKADPLAAKDLEMNISAEATGTQVIGFAALRSAGYDVGDAEHKLSPDLQKNLQDVSSISSVFDVPLTQVNPAYLDLMWAIYGATGKFEPVSKVASTLALRADYEAFEKVRESGKRLTMSDLTPSMIRGLTYMAAGWSISSFQVNDPLAADYIEYMLASPDVPDAVKAELKGLQTNPAFREPGGKAQ